MARPLVMRMGAEAAEASDRGKEGKTAGFLGLRERQTRRDRDPWGKGLGKKEDKGRVPV